MHLMFHHIPYRVPHKNLDKIQSVITFAADGVQTKKFTGTSTNIDIQTYTLKYPPSFSMRIHRCFSSISRVSLRLFVIAVLGRKGRLNRLPADRRETPVQPCLNEVVEDHRAQSSKFRPIRWSVRQSPAGSYPTLYR